MILRLPNIAAVQEFSGNIKRLAGVPPRGPKAASVFCGRGNMADRSFACGAHGRIGTLAKIAESTVDVAGIGWGKRLPAKEGPQEILSRTYR